MFRAKTLLVLGAGASAEVGLPIGAKLLESIVGLTNISYRMGRQERGDFHVSEALKRVLNEGSGNTEYNAHLHAAWQLSASAKQALSIDNVIDALEDRRVELVGKIGIVRAIHEAEKASKYFQNEEGFHDKLDISLFKNTWYDLLTKLLTENVRKSQVENVFDNLEIINFNYDRCLESYLPYSLANYYGLELKDARSIMVNLVTHRPYGVAGRLPWQAGTAPAVDFGGGAVEQTAAVASEIRTFTEQVEEGEALSRIRSAARAAERIVFLGFAFHRQNVELIADKVVGNAEIVGTAFEVSQSDRDVIESELMTAFELEGALAHQRVSLANLTCAKFFQENWRTLTADAPPDSSYSLSSL